VASRAGTIRWTATGWQCSASLPPRLRTAVELRLAGYLWDEAAQQLGVSASTLRGYLPELRAKFVDFSDTTHRNGLLNR